MFKKEHTPSLHDKEKHKKNMETQKQRTEEQILLKLKEAKIISESLYKKINEVEELRKLL